MAVRHATVEGKTVMPGWLAGLASLVVPVLVIGSAAHERPATVQIGSLARVVADTDTVRKRLFVVRFRYLDGTPEILRSTRSPEEVEQSIVESEWNTLPTASMELLTMRQALERLAPPDTARPCDGIEACEVIDISEGPGVTAAGRDAIRINLVIGPPSTKRPPKHPDHAPPEEEDRDYYTCPYPERTSDSFRQCRIDKATFLMRAITRHLTLHRSNP